MQKALSNNLTWYKTQWYNDLKSCHQKTTKNHTRKKQENKDNLVGPFDNQIMYLAILIFGGKLLLECFKKKYFLSKLEIWYYIVYVN